MCGNETYNTPSLQTINTIVYQRNKRVAYVPLIPYINQIPLHYLMKDRSNPDFVEVQCSQGKYLQAINEFRRGCQF